MAPGWERHREYMWATTRHVAEWLIDHVAVEPGEVVLDLAGGAGDTGSSPRRR
jgi:ubiquinone/menaquinone biosynthesis C-methylase UbiE